MPLFARNDLRDLQILPDDLQKFAAQYYRENRNPWLDNTVIFGDFLFILVFLGETFEKDEFICFSITGANMNEKYFKVGRIRLLISFLSF